MVEENKKRNTTMTVAELKQILVELEKKKGGDFEVWLSSDEEGNEYLPMLKNTELSWLAPPLYFPYEQRLKTERYNPADENGQTVFRDKILAGANPEEFQA